MAKLILGSVVATFAVATVGSVPVESGHVILLDPTAAPETESVRNLLLSAAGRRTPEPGEVRIPVPVDGAEYEVIVVKPGQPMLSRAK